jgi:hypothetical protein
MVLVLVLETRWSSITTASAENEYEAQIFVVDEATSPGCFGFGFGFG